MPVLDETVTGVHHGGRPVARVLRRGRQAWSSQASEPEPAPAPSIESLLLDPSFEDTATQQWRGRTRATVEKSVEQYVSGARALKVVCTAPGFYDVDTNNALTAVTGGTTYRFTAPIRPVAVARQFLIAAEWFGGSGGAVNFQTATLPADTWTPVTGTLTAPSGATQARLIVRCTAGASGEVFFMDDAALLPT